MPVENLDLGIAGTLFVYAFLDGQGKPGQLDAASYQPALLTIAVHRLVRLRGPSRSAQKLYTVGPLDGGFL